MTKKIIAIEAIRNVHADTSVSLEQTKSDLEELHDLAQELIEAVEEDIKALTDEN